MENIIRARKHYGKRKIEVCLCEGAWCGVASFGGEAVVGHNLDLVDRGGDEMRHDHVGLD